MPTPRIRSLASALSAEQLRREAALLIFCEPTPEECSRLNHISDRHWQKLLRWLDVNGLALYFLDRMVELQRCDILPSAILQRLQQNMENNVQRTEGLAAESVAIQRKFQKVGLSYAVLKGLSLCPQSVPKAELRHQFDLDFLVAEESASEARRILEHDGYRLYAIRGRSLEFKINERPVFGLDDIYKDSPGRAVELHIERGDGLLGRLKSRDLCGMHMPVLSPVDLFLGQGLHAYKHVHSEFVRAAHLLEFRRHIIFRHNDLAFWRELQSVALEKPQSAIRLGVVTQLIARTMGEFAPNELTNWTVDCLPQSAGLWIDLYGRRVMLDDFPGSKLYLLLQKALGPSGVPSNRSVRQTLLPAKLPHQLIRPAAHEPLSMRARRYRLQLGFIFGRLRFHVKEWLCYVRESYRWIQSVKGAVR